ncbi:MAG: two-component regulator propeller domain-containing protein [Muribaculaceae bacterium]
MRYIIISFIFIAVGVIRGAGHTVESNLYVDNLSLKDGLSNNFVTAISQDKNGFLWVGTESGLNRFDGDNFMLYHENNSLLSGNSINALYYDENTDRLWVGSKKGLNVLDCSTQEFLELSVPDSVGSVNVVSIFRSNDGHIYAVNHYNFILRYDADGTGFKVIRSDDFSDMPSSLLCMTDDGNGNFLIGHENYGLSVLNVNNKHIHNYRHIEGNDRSLPGNIVRAIHVDRYKNIWVGTNNGLALFNPMSGEFTTYHQSNAEHGVRKALNVYSIMESREGALWIGSDIGGVCMLDIGDLSMSNPDRLNFVNIPSKGTPYGSSSANVRSVFQDSFGNVWLGNYSEGIDFISRVQPQFSILPYFLNNNGVMKEKQVRSLFTDSDGSVWVGGENEVAVFVNGKMRNTYNLTQFMTTHPGYVCAIARVGNEMLLSLFDDGLLRLDTSSGRIERIKAPGELNYANCISVMRNNRVLLGMQGGLYEYRSGQMYRLDRISAAISDLIPNGIAEDSRGNLWIGTYGNGVFVFDPGDKLLYHLDSDHGLSSKAVKQIYIDSRGWMWIAGQDGMSLIRDTAKPSEIEKIDLMVGLTDVHIHAVQEDANGNVWFSNSSTLAKWNKETSKIETYDYNDRLPHGSFMDRAACSTADGTIYFGSLNGVCTFRPTESPRGDDRARVSIVDCKCIVNPSADFNVMEYVDKGTVMEIPHDMNSLRITFSVPDYSRSRVVEFAYMVENLDNTWIMAGKEHEATLNNLSPGKYVFKVKARLRNREWDEANMVGFSFEIEPPLWLTWYAKLFYAIVVVGIMYLIIKFYKHRLQLQSSLEMERRKSADSQQLNNERLRFYTNITHELRTPLTLILGPLEDLVADVNLPDGYKKQVKTIHSSALRLLNLINQILEFRKTETQNRQLAVAKGRISSLVTEVGLRYKELNHNKKVAIHLNIDGNIPEVYFDSDVVHTILNNLLSNAVKYTPEGAINLSLCTIDDEGTKWVEMKVADTGYGIDENALPHIFERYYQAEGKHQASGTGIGLALVQSLSDLHQGKLSVESQVGKGTAFSFRISVDNTYPDAIHKDNSEKTEPIAEQQSPVDKADKRPLVLVVEDNDDIREYIEASLHSKFKVIQASNGSEGMDLARKNVPDLIVSDIMMPMMDGMEMCKLLKSDIATSHIPVILLTAKDSLHDREAGYDIGADSYLTKPFSAKLLISRINNILESRRALALLISARLRGTVLPTDETEDDAVPRMRLSRIDEEFIKKFTRIVEENIAVADLDMTHMQQTLNMSHSTLYRKIKGLTGMSGNEFIRKLRLKRGKELLIDGCNVSEAAFSCGFNDVGYFRNCFKEEYGMSPSQFIKEKVRQNQI